MKIPTAHCLSFFGESGVNMEKCNVGIVGCGLGGVATAVAIQRAGHHVTILEQANGVNEVCNDLPRIQTYHGKKLTSLQVGAGIQLPHNCTRILKNWGILSTVQLYATLPSNVVLRAYKDSRVLFKRQNPAIADNVHGTPHLLLHRANFLKTLFEEAKRLGVVFQFGAIVTSIDFEQAKIRLLDGGECAYDVIFGADGSKSVCRELLLGKLHGPQLSGDVAYRIMIPASEVKADEELSAFTEGSDISCWMGPDAHAVCYRLKEENMVNVVLVGPYNSSASGDGACSDRQEMEALFANWDASLQKLFRLAETVLKRRLQGSHEVTSWIHPNGKFALVGDACHTTLPTL